ncbi:MAG: CHAT domain-containing protein [Rhodocyclaceae bacterium]|nr:CHAT domain-containing protein [Rhodocyclaceae bacterium]
MKRLVFFVGFTLALLALPVSADEAEWEELMDAGRTAYEKGDYETAFRQFEKSLKEAEAMFGLENPYVAVSLSNLAALYQNQGRYSEAEPRFKRSLTILEKAGGASHPAVATTLNNLALLYRDQGRYSEAEMLLKRALAIREKTYNSEHPSVAASVLSMAALYQDQGRYSEAESLYKRSLAIYEKALGPAHPNVATSLNNLASLYQTQGRYADAESAYKHSLSISEIILGPEHPDVATSLNNLALLYQTQDRYQEAELLYMRSLVIYEMALGLEHLSVATSLNNLAALYRNQARYSAAELLYKRSLAIREKSLGTQHPDIATSLNNLAELYIDLNRYPEAEPLIKRSLAIYEKTHGPKHSSVATILLNLASLYEGQGRSTDAELLLRRSVAISEEALGLEHPNVATGLHNLALFYRDQGRYSEAEPLIKASLAIYENTFGLEHSDVAVSLGNLASLYSRLNRQLDALTPARRATGIYTNHFSLKNDTVRFGLRSEQRRLAFHFENHVHLLNAAGPQAGSLEAVTAESFEVAQWARVSDTAEQVAKMAARHAAGNDAMAKVARERQDLLAYLEKLETAWLAEVSKAAAQRNAERIRQLKQTEEETKTKLSVLDAHIANDFPRYGELTQPRPLSLVGAQKLLGADEAMVLWLVGKEESYLWALRRDKVLFERIALKRDELDVEVRALRLKLDLGASNKPELLLAQSFDAARSHELYRKLLAPAEKLLTGAKHLILVPDGPLQSLPPAVLVSEAPNAPIDHREVAWLIKKYAVTVLPSVSSLRALRAYAQGTPAKEPLIGFGDPVLEGMGPPSAQDQTRKNKVPTGLVSRGLVADPKDVRKMEPLPNTADELKLIAASLKAPTNALNLGDQATERKVKQSDLASARVIAFATHGLMAEEFHGLAEPALVLTPPQQASEFDDGLLTASEILQLKLNADWVVLSACNTAASDGKPGAEGLSGLARAFFYAGAHALMVTHWAVETNSSAALTTGVFEKAAKGLSKAEALRQSMLAHMQRKDIPYAHHPAMWAPFILVGE